MTPRRLVAMRHVYVGPLVLLALLLWPASARGQAGQEVEVEYYHLDALGSVRAVTNDVGQVVARHDFLPFGEEWNPSPTARERKLFTGHERDAETGLDYFGARYYRPQVGRFTTIDPVYTWSENLTDPQRWNRYTYVRNNPLKYTDPDGRDPVYANAALRSFFEQLAARSSIVRGTLSLYTGPGKPDLFISQGEAGHDIGGEKALGTFNAKIEVVYPPAPGGPMPGMSLEQMQNTGRWSTTNGTLVLDSSLSINIQNKDTVSVAAHELGHADQAATDALGYERDRAAIRKPNGTLIPHDDRRVEIKADVYRNRVWSQIRF